MVAAAAAARGTNTGAVGRSDAFVGELFGVAGAVIAGSSIGISTAGVDGREVG